MLCWRRVCEGVVFRVGLRVESPIFEWRVVSLEGCDFCFLRRVEVAIFSFFLASCGGLRLILGLGFGFRLFRVHRVGARASGWVWGVSGIELRA